MEGSVQNLLNAEKEAKSIVAKAEKECRKQAEQANTHAQQKLNQRTKEWEKKMKEDAELVSTFSKAVVMEERQSLSHQGALFVV